MIEPNILSCLLIWGGVLVQGNSSQSVARLKKIIEDKYGIVCKGDFEDCNKYIYLSDLSGYTNLDSCCKWNFISCEIKKVYFGMRDFVGYCLKKKMHGTVLNIVVCNEKIESYQIMIKGFAKNLAQYHIKFNLIEIKSDDTIVVDNIISFLTDMHSAHINGECFELSEG